jgi:hypothetical protein
MTEEAMREAEKVTIVTNFHNRIMGAVLDGTELEFFAYLEAFFNRIAKEHYDRGWNDGFRVGINRKEQPW